MTSENAAGYQYVLTYNSPKPDCQVDEIKSNGTVCSLVQQSPDEFEYTEYTEIIEVQG